jgi:hypothetical protein
VNIETQRYLELLDRRIALLGSIAEALTAARGDIVSLDVDGLEARISRQEILCGEVRSLDVELDRIQEHCTQQIRLPVTEEGRAIRNASALRLRETRDRLQLAQARVKQLNEAHQILLRRCRRTAGALLNSYATFATTYSDPFARSARGPFMGRPREERT